MKKFGWLEEPLVRFVLLGLLVFAADRALRPEDVAARRIEITPAFREAMARREEERTGAAPSEIELEAAIERFVREEALYREAVELGLDRGDLIVRRRLVQKMELWLDAQHAGEGEPGREELTAWYEAHAAQLREPSRTALEVVFFADGSTERARAALDRGVDASSGDPFVHGRSIGPWTDAQIDTLFGDGVARAVGEVEVAAWSPPIQGRAGVFLLRPTDRVEGRTPPLGEVRERAAREIVEARRERARDRAVDAILARWDVVRADR